MNDFPINTIKTYLPHLKAVAEPISNGGLPLLYKKLYSTFKLFINGNPFLAVVVKEKDQNLGAREFKKHLNIFEEKYKLPVIWCLIDLPFLKTQRLIEGGFNFIVKNKIVYLPILNTVIKIDNKTIGSKNIKINSLGINILLTQVIEENLDGLNKVELARKFNVGKMTIGRAIETLVSNNLCFEEKLGVQKNIKFANKDEIWNFFKNKVETPIVEIKYLQKEIKKVPLSGISALAVNTMLADDEIPTYAISKKKLKELTTLQITSEDNAKTKLEVWSREPIVTKEGTINVLDAFLILKDDNNERVQIALEDWLKKFDFKI